MNPDCATCVQESAEQSKRWGFKVQTMCRPCGKALLERVRNRPLPGKPGNHITEVE